MGALLLGAGAVSSVLALLGAEVALVFLGALGAVGMVTARTLPEVSARSPIPDPRVRGTGRCVPERAEGG